MIRNKLVLAAMLAATCGFNAQAQDDGFDLSSQRAEKQDINMVPGKKIDHKGIVINPTPHNLDINRESWLDL